jgi:hypothetical protein
MNSSKKIISFVFAAALALPLAAQTAPRTDRLVNLSARVRVPGGSSVLVSGFVIAGPAPKQVIVRAIGPGLTAFGVAGAMPNPKIVLYRDNNIVHENDDWEASPDPTALAAASARVGAFPLAAGSKDAAILATLAPGNYTALVSDVNGAPGDALVEIYDAGASATPEFQRLVNISARGEITATSSLIGGFVIAGNTPKKLLVRGVGPALAAFGIAAPLADPVLKIYDATGAFVAQNDNWETAAPLAPGQTAATAAEIASAGTATGAFALAAGSRDAAMIVTLAPGAYTALVSGVGASTGTALVEVYEVNNN